VAGAGQSHSDPPIAVIAHRRLFRQQRHFPAYRCHDCDGYYTLLTGTAFAKTRQSPATLVLLLRGITKGDTTARLARTGALAAPVAYAAAPRADQSE
jgi:hypothetical protein